MKIKFWSRKEFERRRRKAIASLKLPIFHESTPLFQRYVEIDNFGNSAYRLGYEAAVRQARKAEK